MTKVKFDALQRLTMQGDGILVDQHGQPFDVRAYSALKYGRVSAAQHYARQLALLLIRRHRLLAVSERRVLVTSAPYPYLAPSANVIATEFMRYLNVFRVNRGLEPAWALHSVRFKVGTDRYAMAGPEERTRIFDQSGRHIDTEFVQNAVVIAIDDVNVTGATNTRLRKLIEPCNPAAVCYLHVATMADQKWALNGENAGIEDVMNRAGAPSLDGILAAIHENDFRLSSRVFHFIMKQEDGDALCNFFAQLSDELLEEMYAALINATVERYRRDPVGTALLEQVITERKLPIAEFISLFRPTPVNA
jgi:hypothetical protein